MGAYIHLPVFLYNAFCLHLLVLIHVASVCTLPPFWKLSAPDSPPTVHTRTCRYDCLQHLAACLHLHDVCLHLAVYLHIGLTVIDLYVFLYLLVAACLDTWLSICLLLPVLINFCLYACCCLSWYIAVFLRYAACLRSAHAYLSSILSHVLHTFLKKECRHACLRGWLASTVFNFDVLKKSQCHHFTEYYTLHSFIAYARIH